MNLFRVIFLLGAVALAGGAGYLSHYGVWRDSLDLDRSVRIGSPGAGGINGRVK